MRRLPEDLLAEETGTAGQQDPQAQATIAVGSARQRCRCLLLKRGARALGAIASDGGLLVAEAMLTVVEPE